MLPDQAGQVVLDLPLDGRGVRVGDAQEGPRGDVAPQVRELRLGASELLHGAINQIRADLHYAVAYHLLTDRAGQLAALADQRLLPGQAGRALLGQRAVLLVVADRKSTRLN